MWEINRKIARFAGLDEAQGADEQRSETYLVYDDRAAEAATQRFAKNNSRVSSSARKQAIEANQSAHVEVLFSYSDGYTRPVQLRWQDESYALGGVQFWYAEHKGNSLVHHYTVGDKDGNYTFQLAMETENLTWKLEKATPVNGLSLNIWQNHGLVGAL